MNRDNWRSTRLTAEDVKMIRSIAEDRDNKRAESRRLREESARLWQEANEVSNPKLAEKFDVSPRTIDGVTQGRVWLDVE